MWSKALILFSVCIHVYADNHVNNQPPPKYDYDQLADLIDRNLQCLEKYDLLTINATDKLVTAPGDMKYLLDSCRLEKKKEDQINEFLERYQKLIDASKQAYPDTNGAKYFWTIFDYVTFGDGSFQYGRLNKGKSTKKSLLEVYLSVQTTPEGDKCLDKLIEQNGFSDNFRTCSNPCKDLAESTNFKSGLRAMDRYNYLDVMFVIRCLNYGPGTFERLIPSCSNLKKYADAFYKNRYSPDYNKYRFSYYDLVVKCSVYGFAEYLDEKFITDVANAIDCNGCVKYTDNDEETQVLTVLAANLFSIALRYTEERLGCQNAKIV